MNTNTQGLKILEYMFIFVGSIFTVYTVASCCVRYRKQRLNTSELNKHLLPPPPEF